MELEKTKIYKKLKKAWDATNGRGVIVVGESEFFEYFKVISDDVKKDLVVKGFPIYVGTRVAKNKVLEGLGRDKDIKRCLTFRGSPVIMR